MAHPDQPIKIQNSWQQKHNQPPQWAHTYYSDPLTGNKGMHHMPEA